MVPKKKWWVSWCGGGNYKIEDITGRYTHNEVLFENEVTFENYWEAWGLYCKCDGKAWDATKHLRFHK